MTATARPETVAFLRERTKDIEAAMLARIRKISPGGDQTDPGYVAGQREAVAAGLAFALTTIENDDDAVEVPDAVRTHARLAVRHRVGLDTLLRRYFAAYALLEQFVMMAPSGESSSRVTVMLDSLASALDRLLVSVSEVYEQETARLQNGNERRRERQIERLLAGEHLSVDEFPYDFDLLHVGLITTAQSRPWLKSVAEAMAAQLLLLPRPGGEEVWAWLGVVGEFDYEKIAAAIHQDQPLALGEPARGLIGWRTAHSQAQRIWPLAMGRPGRASRYREFGLITTVIADEALSEFLRAEFLDPLSPDDPQGKVLLATLNSYLAAGQNISSAAASLGVTRHTVSKRLSLVEERLGMPLWRMLPEIHVALRLLDAENSSVVAGDGRPNGIPASP